VRARELELLRLDVGPIQAHPAVLLAEHGENGADAAADLEQPRAGLEPGAVAFEVLSGSLGLRVDGVEGDYGPGEVILAEAGSPHAAWNAG
jgi:hypothetical protein